MKASVVLPTRNAMHFLPAQIPALARQDYPTAELIAVDTESTDGTVEVLRKAATQLVGVSTHEFGHGITRNHAASLASGEIIVFLTQDALPLSEDWLRMLITPILTGRAVASFGRQVARPGANAVESFARQSNYPSESRVVSASDIKTLGIRAYFFSNACSAIRRDVFEGLGGFPTHTIMNEDMLFAAKLLKAGHKIAYVAEAVVEHSHSYTLWQTFKRYFDIGVVLEQAKSDLVDHRVTKEGLRYVRGLFTALWRDGQYAWILVAVAESAAKWVGTFLGKRYKLLPLSVTRRLSMHSTYWDRTF